MGERILDPDEPLVKGHIVVFGCPNKKCKAPKFIESDDGKVRCQCGTQLINMNQNHLLKHLVPSPSQSLEKGTHYEYLQGSSKDKLTILSTYLAKTRLISEQQKIYDSYIRKMLFRNNVNIVDNLHREHIKMLLDKFQVPFKIIGTTLCVDNNYINGNKDEKGDNKK